ncbi:MAG: hypothetical protein GY925_19410 [Actinomycetia bacterium]|nr:hypothetical protein [Actinomycetes bacterium]
MTWLRTNLIGPATDLLSELEVGESLIAEHTACVRLSLGVEGLFRSEIRHRWAGWPPESTTDGSSVMACSRVDNDTLIVIGLTDIDFAGEQFPFQLHITNIGSGELTVTVHIGQLDSATGGPPRLRDAVITIGLSDTTAGDQPILTIGRRQAAVDWTEVLTFTIPVDEEPSPRLVAQRVRNRIIEYLELASSFEAQVTYREHAPIAHVPNEVINQWEDWVPTPPRNAEWDNVVYSADELEAIDAFHSTWDRVAAALPNELQTLEQVQSLVEWVELREAAAGANAVFNRRGRFPEDKEI